MKSFVRFVTEILNSIYIFFRFTFNDDPWDSEHISIAGIENVCFQIYAIVGAIQCDKAIEKWK